MKHFFVLLIAITIFSCRKDDDFKPDEPVVIEEAQTLKDVAYGNDKLQKWIFIFRPAGLQQQQKL
ncbi:hypothetical protein LWM68_31050 [Niabella sp. W65]|nr:hypothetical protein [Niabella sp. W65]MCH7366814.1 hypothetical protein [Niabella sp. W65]ULT42517.1 hypothetical protein KRR40_02595 [Niabella sp. I65]